MTDAVPVPATETQRALRNVSALTLATVVSKGLLFLWQLVLARFLGEAGYGLYGTMWAPSSPLVRPLPTSVLAQSLCGKWRARQALQATIWV